MRHLFGPILAQTCSTTAVTEVEEEVDGPGETHKVSELNSRSPSFSHHLCFSCEWG